MAEKDQLERQILDRPTHLAIAVHGAEAQRIARDDDEAPSLARSRAPNPAENAGPAANSAPPTPRAAAPGADAPCAWSASAIRHPAPPSGWADRTRPRCMGCDAARETGRSHRPCRPADRAVPTPRCQSAFAGRVSRHHRSIRPRRTDAVRTQIAAFGDKRRHSIGHALIGEAEAESALAIQLVELFLVRLIGDLHAIRRRGRQQQQRCVVAWRRAGVLLQAQGDLLGLIAGIAADDRQRRPAQPSSRADTH